MKSKDLPVIEDPKPLQMITLENSTKYDAHRKSPQKILNARTRTQRLQKHTQFKFAHTHTETAYAYITHHAHDKEHSK